MVVQFSDLAIDPAMAERPFNRLWLLKGWLWRPRFRQLHPNSGGSVAVLLQPALPSREIDE